MAQWGDVEGLDAAKVALSCLEQRDTRNVALQSFVKFGRDAAELLTSKGSVLDVGVSELSRFMADGTANGDVTDGSEAAVAGAQALTAATLLLGKSEKPISEVGSVLTPSVVGAIRHLLGYVRRLSSVLPDSEVNERPKGTYDTYVALVDAVEACVEFRALGVDAPTRLANDSSSACVRAAISSKKLFVETLEKCESKPGVLDAMLDEATSMLNDAKDRSPFHFGIGGMLDGNRFFI